MTPLIFYRFKCIILLKITTSPFRACAACACQVLFRRCRNRPVADVLPVSKIYTLIAFYQRIVDLWCHVTYFSNVPRTCTIIAWFLRLARVPDIQNRILQYVRAFLLMFVLFVPNSKRKCGIFYSNRRSTYVFFHSISSDSHHFKECIMHSKTLIGYI